MALKLSYSDQYGTTHGNAYHRVTEINRDIMHKQIRIEVSTYKDKDARDGGKKEILRRYFELSALDEGYSKFELTEIDKAGVNDIKQSYEYLKTLDDWSQAENI